MNALSTAASTNSASATNCSSHDLLNSMLCNYLPTPVASDQFDANNLSSFEQQLQTMIGLDGLDQILDLQHIPMDSLQSIGSADCAQTAKLGNGLQRAMESQAAAPSPNMLSNDNQIKSEGLVSKSSAGRKRKIKREDGGQSSNSGQPAAKRRRGRSQKGSDWESVGERMKRDSDKLLSPNNTDSGFIGIRTADGEVRVPLPARITTPYEVFGNACTDKIEDILQAKGRTRYVRGLSEKEKKDRRREQNRNAAARSRARKNAMISKVIQLHQENLGLRAHAADTIAVIARLQREVKELKQLKYDGKT